MVKTSDDDRVSGEQFDEVLAAIARLTHAGNETIPLLRNIASRIPDGPGSSHARAVVLDQADELEHALTDLVIASGAQDREVDPKYDA